MPSSNRARLLPATKQFVFRMSKRVLSAPILSGLWGAYEYKIKLNNGTRYMYPPFHNDCNYLEVVRELITESNVSNFVETGTCFADTARFMASTFPRLRIYTCDNDKMRYEGARRSCRRFGNVQVFYQSSPEFLEQLIPKLSGLTIFFLDAHWWRYWPLRDECRIICGLEKFIVIIDDFKVPGNSSFGYDYYGNDINSLEYVADVMGHECLSPSYAPPADNPDLYRGYGIFLKGVGIPKKASRHLTKVSVAT